MLVEKWPKGGPWHEASVAGGLAFTNPPPCVQHKKSAQEHVPQAIISMGYAPYHQVPAPCLHCDLSDCYFSNCSLQCEMAWLL